MRNSTTCLTFYVVYWPTCLIPQANEAVLNRYEGEELKEHPKATDAKTLEECMSECKGVSLEDCSYWSWNKANSTCTFRGLLKMEGAKSKPRLDVVTGEKYCTGKSKLCKQGQFAF